MICYPSFSRCCLKNVQHKAYKARQPECPRKPPLGSWTHVGQGVHRRSSWQQGAWKPSLEHCAHHDTPPMLLSSPHFDPCTQPRAHTHAKDEHHLTMYHAFTLSPTKNGNLRLLAIRMMHVYSLLLLWLILINLLCAVLYCCCCCCSFLVVFVIVNLPPTLFLIRILGHTVSRRVPVGTYASVWPRLSSITYLSCPIPPFVEVQADVTLSRRNPLLYIMY